MTRDDIIRMALDALERCVATCFDRYAHEQVMSRPEHFVNQAITALRQALEQPAQQEPVAWADVHDYTNLYYRKPAQVDVVPLYYGSVTPPAAQRQWVGLTDDELEIINDCGDTDSYKFARAIEAKLKEKNT